MAIGGIYIVIPSYIEELLTAHSLCVYYFMWWLKDVGDESPYMYVLFEREPTLVVALYVVEEPLLVKKR